MKTSDKQIKIKLPNNIKNGIYMIKVSDDTIDQTSQFILYR